MKKIFVIILSLVLLLFSNINANEIKILYKLENEIITNHDINNELNYLISLNNNLTSLGDKKLNQIAVNSAIKEKIKYLELINYFKLDEDNVEVDEIVLKELFTRLNINDVDSLKRYFTSYNLNLDQVKFKIKVELFWNKLIFDKYQKNISINKNELKNKLINDLKNKDLIEEYFLKEILFKLEENEILDEKYENIKETIENTGFENAANIFSISNTAKFGGKIGWVSKIQLSKKITNELDKIEKNNFTNYIPVGNGYLIVKVEDKRQIKTEFDLEKETKILIQKETDRQLNQYSTNYFNKLKKNIFIYEL